MSSLIILKALKMIQANYNESERRLIWIRVTNDSLKMETWKTFPDAQSK